MTSTRTRTGLRTIAESFVVAPPSGTSTRTRLHPTDTEADGLRQIGMYLGSLYRSDVVARSKIGVVPKKLNGRAERKRDLTTDTSSRWAGTITRAAEDQYQLGLRALTAEIITLNSATRKLRQRLAVPAGTKDAAGVAGYRSRAEHGAKTLRLRALETRLRDAETRRGQGSPTIVLGGGRLWSARQNLAAAGLTEATWRTKWDAARMFLTADGESTQLGGNQTIRVTADGLVQVKVPGALETELGSHLRLTVPVTFALRGAEWADRAQTRQAIRYDITYDPDKDRWYLDASWGYGKVAAPPLATLRAGRVIGVDLNVDHLTAAVIDPAGNPVGTPAIIPLLVDGLSAGARDGHLRHAITTLLDRADAADATAIAIENLNFTESRETGKETMGRGARGKRFRRQVAGIPTGKFRERLTAMAANRGIHIIAVDPAYTSRWGGQHWTKPLQQRTSGSTVTRHQAAAVAIGRRAHGHRIKRRKDGDRTQQRMRPTPPLTGTLMKPVNASTALTGPTRRQPPKLTG
jgi:IS605 OrfB family transposase